MPARPRNLERNLKKLHHFLGLAVLPWLIVLGLGALLLNHAPVLRSLLPYTKPADLAVLDNWPDAQPVSANAAGAIARRTWPWAVHDITRKGFFRDLPVFRIASDAGEVIVLRDTGFYWVQTRFWRVFHDTAGRELSRTLRFGVGAGHSHAGGLAKAQVFEILADLVSVMLVAFGVSGLALVLVPRRRRRHSHKARIIPSFPSSRST